MFISAEYRLEADEFARGILAAFRRSHRRLQALGLVVWLVLAGDLAISVSKHVPAPSLALTVSMLLVGLYGILVPLVRGVALRRQYRQRNVRGVSVTFADDGVTWRVRTEGGEHRSVVTWASYVKIRETSEFFLLYSSRKQATVVPKRAFRPDDVGLFSRFVEHGFEQARLAQPEAAVQA